MHSVNQYSPCAMKAQSLRLTLREATGNAIVNAAERVAARDGLRERISRPSPSRPESPSVRYTTTSRTKPRLFDALFTRRREELFATIDAATKRHRSEPFAVQLDASCRPGLFGYFDVPAGIPAASRSRPSDFTSSECGRQEGARDRQQFHAAGRAHRADRSSPREAPAGRGAHIFLHHPGLISSGRPHDPSG